jgi:predicted N-acetyltransferase YhbS
MKLNIDSIGRNLGYEEKERRTVTQQREEQTTAAKFEFVWCNVAEFVFCVFFSSSPRPSIANNQAFLNGSDGASEKKA